MGADLLLMCAVIDADRSPDWAAAERHVESMAIEAFEENSDLLERFAPEIVECEALTDDDEVPQGLEPEPLRRQLHKDLAEFRVGVAGERRDIDYLEVRGARVYITGGSSYGDTPTDIWEPMARLDSAGALAAAGFDD